MHEPVANNPYSILIEECHNDEKQIQARYSAHRNSREIDQRVKVLSSDFPGVSIDPILRGLLDERARRQNVNLANIPRRESVRFHDERHNLVFWIRPPTHIRDLIVQCQAKLKEAIPRTRISFVTTCIACRSRLILSQISTFLLLRICI